MRRALVLLALALVAAGCSTPAQQEPPAPGGGGGGTTTTTTTTPFPDASMLRLEPVLAGLSMPTLVTHAGDGSGRLFVLEQEGRIRVARNGSVLETPFLDLRDQVASGGERGLLGLAFHPGYEENGAAFVSYTDLDGDSVLARYLVDPDDPDRLDPASGEVLLRVDQPFPNHNGGHLAFGPDGFLYYGLGDGGAAGDPQGNGQDPHALLGSLLRLDVGPQGPTRIPPDNPWADGEAGAPEVWAKGLRNPWRFSFDRATGDLYVADVGQNQWEEVNFQPAGAPGGANYGWNVWEGRERYSRLADTFSTPVAPVAVYPTDDGCAVTGGHVYRGEGAPSLRGTYLYADYCNGQVWGLRHDGEAWRTETLLDTGLRVSSFGEDEAGEVYVVHHGGEVRRLVEA